MRFSSVAFSRPSVAYLSSGAQVASGQPRFEAGKFGQALEVEEGTTNLLTANQSSVETDTTGFYTSDNNVQPGAVLSRVTVEKWQDATSLAVTTNGAAIYQGVGIRYVGSALSGTLTFSVYVKAPAGTPMRIIIWDNTNATYPTPNVITWTANGSWERKSITFTLSAASLNISCQITLNNSTAALIFYVDGAQLEAKPYSTSWILGGSTRSPEVPTIPTAGVFTPGNWTKEFYFIPTSPQVITGKTGYLWDLYIDANNYYALKIGPDGKPYLEIKSNGTLYQTATTSAPVLAVNTPYAFAVRGNGSLMALFVNGTKISEVAYAEPIGTLPANMYLGCDHNGANHTNGKFDDYRASKIARTDVEIATTYQIGRLKDDKACVGLWRFQNNLLGEDHLAYRKRFFLLID